MQKPQGTDVTIRDIAAEVGCSHASVSRALRGQPRVSEALRVRIKETAKQMGYRPNPLVSSLMAAHNKKSARASLSANIAWLNTHPNKEFWHVYPHNKRFHQAAMERALELGFGFDEIWACEPGLTGERLHQILQTRGIHGLLVANVCEVMNKMHFDWSPYTVAAIGSQQTGQLDWHRAGISSRLNMEIAFDQLSQRKYRRIGYLLPTRGKSENQIQQFNTNQPGSDTIIDSDVLRAELAGYYFRQQSVAPEQRIAPFLYNRDDEDHFVEPIAAWIQRERPDAIIGRDVQLLEAAKLAGFSVPKDLAIIHLGIANDVKDWAGINTHPEHQAAAAVELLTNSILYNQRGLPEAPRTIHVKGEWQDGWTAPERK